MRPCEQMRWALGTTAAYAVAGMCELTTRSSLADEGWRLEGFLDMGAREPIIGVGQ